LLILAFLLLGLIVVLAFARNQGARAAPAALPPTNGGAYANKVDIDNMGELGFEEGQ
jgi:hypothetical protein